MGILDKAFALILTVSHPGSCLKGALKYVTPSEARGLGWWVRAAMEKPYIRFLAGSLLL